MKIGLISSSGGHLFKTLQLKPWWSQHQRFWVTSQSAKQYQLPPQEKVYLGHFPENRHLTNFFRNFLLAWKILLKERPQVLFSTGAGIAPPFFLVAKILGIKLIFLETFILINHPTLSGKLVYPLSNLFLVQNQPMLTHYPRAKYFGQTL